VNATAAPPPEDDDLPAEINFSGATRGKFYRPGARLNLPLYLGPDVQASLAALAARKGVRRSKVPMARLGSRPLRLVDASCISKPGSVGTDWRLHAMLEPAPRPGSVSSISN
jgi:hypothetical protein